MPHLKRHFLGWDEPVVKLAVKALTANWQEGVLDLQDTMILVPTRNAGRRFREALAEVAAARNTAAMPGAIALPEQLLAPASPPAQPAATPFESLAAWTRLMLDLEVKHYPALFPYNPEGFVQDVNWALSAAERFQRLRTELAENGLDIHAAARLLADQAANPEPDRWEDLARLETAYLSQLQQLGRQDANTAKIQAAYNPYLPKQIKRIVMMAVADPLPLALCALERLAERVQLDIFIHAPATAAGRFDEWGRPLPEAWINTVIDIPDPARNLLIAQRPENQARLVDELIRGVDIPFNDLAIGVPDEDVLPFLEREIENAGGATFNPAGRPLANHALARFTQALINFLKTPNYRQTATLIRHPDLLSFFTAYRKNFHIALLLNQLDDIQNQHLPVTFADLHRNVSRRIPGSELAHVCGKLEEYLNRNKERWADTGDFILEILREVYGHRKLELRVPEDRIFQQTADGVSRNIREINSAPVQQANLPEEAVLGIMARRLQATRFYEDRQDAAIDLQGWLELAWEDAPHLLITGMNEGRVPASITADPFLPESARTVLGLADNRRRFARDAYMLHNIIATRRQGGSVVLITGKSSAQGDPLKPSRLLFLCSDNELPERAAQLFAENQTAGKAVSREHSWQLRIPAAELPERISVTQFRGYLACPLRFYLDHILGMEEKDDNKSELDALDFGSLGHDALEILGAADLRGCADPIAIEARLLGRLEELTRNRFGENWPVTIYFQIEALRQRLKAAAQCQARLNEEGWKIIDTECNLGNGEGIEFAGMKIRGRVDRIDRHANGAIRILDYKTSETATPPQKTMWTTPKPHTPEYARLEINGKERAWADLQLPLYVIILQDRFPGVPIESGYFNLPKALSDTGVAGWTPDDRILASAKACAIGVIEDIRAGRFWPPAEKIQYDDYEKLFFGAPMEFIEQFTYGSGGP